MNADTSTALRLHSSFNETFRSLLADGGLHYARCSVCGVAVGYTARLCREGHSALEWVRAGGGATLVGITVYHQSYSDAFPTPYAVAQVELDEGPQLVVPIDIGALPLHPGVRLAARVSDGRLVFVPA